MNWYWEALRRGRVDFKGDTAGKSPCWHQVSNLWPSDPDLLWFAAIPSLQDLAIFMASHGRAPFKWPVLWGTTLLQSPASCLEHIPDFSQRLYAIKEFAAHLPGFHAPTTEPCLGFCQQHPEFPSGHPSKYFQDQMLLNFSVQMVTGVSNMAWSADELVSSTIIPCFQNCKVTRCLQKQFLIFSC